MTQTTRPLRTIALLALLLVFFCRPITAYSVLTHEQLIDLTWKSSIRPLLLNRYPNLTETQLLEAHAYAYGGCAIQDLGYYPTGSMFFSSLTHYVRTGDFVASLFHNAHNANELAFAVGALSHYVGDTTGHPYATNRAVALEFPSLAKKYGPVVNYAQGEHAHVQVEFAFDIDEINKHRFAPSAYLKHIGLAVPTHQLALAYFETYGLGGDYLSKRNRITLRGYRFAVRSLLPRVAYAENVLHRHGFPDDAPGPDIDLLKQQLAQADFENGWDQYRKKPGIGTYSLAGLIFVLPKIGPLKVLDIKGPTAETKKEYVASVNAAIAELRRQIARVQAEKSAFTLADRDLDTGDKVKPGGYKLTDSTYAQLLHEITRTTAPVPYGLKDDILAYYADPNAPIATRANPKRWAEVLTELHTLKARPTTRHLPDIPTPPNLAPEGQPLPPS